MLHKKCFIGEKNVILGTDSSTLQKGLQSRPELMHWVLYCLDCFCFPYWSTELFPQLEGGLRTMQNKNCICAHADCGQQLVGRSWFLGMSPLLRTLFFSTVWKGGLSDWIPKLGIRECSSKIVAVVIIYIWFGLKQEQTCRGIEEFGVWGANCEPAALLP